MELKVKTRCGKILIILFDECDHEILMMYKWGAHWSGKAWYVRRVEKINGKQKTFRLHRELLGVTAKDMVVDHINHNTLDNRRCNLRICTIAENSRNTSGKKHGTSKYLGVSICKNGEWQSHISIDGKNIYLGRFKNEIDAAKAYDEKAINRFGEFANPNFK